MRFHKKEPRHGKRCRPRANKSSVGFSTLPSLGLFHDVSTYQEQMARSRDRTTMRAMAFLSFYVGWVVLATFGAVDWPGQFAAVFGGMQFQYLLFFVISPWIKGEPK